MLSLSDTDGDASSNLLDFRLKKNEPTSVKIKGKQKATRNSSDDLYHLFEEFHSRKK